MYKNASSIIRNHAKNRPTSVLLARHNIAVARISKHVARAGKMLQCNQHPAHGDVVDLPLLVGKEAGDDVEEDSSRPKIEVLQRGRNLSRRSANVGMGRYDNTSVKRLDKERIANIMQKVTDASLEATPDWEKTLDSNRRRLAKRSHKEKKGDCYTNQHEVMLALERKLKYAMMSAHQGVDSDTMEVRKNLTTRDLLPFYQISDLKNFIEIFVRVDDDFSGDLNVNEWLEFFISFNESVTGAQARRMFAKMDEDADGFLSLRDLVPVIFNRAKKEQVTLILKYLEAEVCTKKVTKKEYVLKEDLNTMFACYDVDLIGFVEVKRIKDKIRSFRMSDQAHLAIFAMFMGYEDDEMLNLAEFCKLFTTYTLKKGSLPGEGAGTG